MFVRPEERSLLTSEIIAAFSLTAPKDELRHRVRELERASYSQLAIQIVEHQEAALEEWADVFELV
jgi:hypothetical protein